MQDIVFIGAGAINRGFLPWIFDISKYGYIYVDNNRKLIDEMNRNGKYSTFRTRKGKLEEKVVTVKKAYHLDEFSISMVDNAAAVFMSVGPRNCLHASTVLKGTKCNIILCENDPESVTIVKNALNYNHVYFAIPDVITSNTAPEETLLNDSLAVHTEDGILFIDEDAGNFVGDINFCSKDELRKQWAAKLYLHNTPHCITAYLGALVGARYLHEAMKYPKIDEIVSGAMKEMLTALKLKWDIPHDFLDWYAEKELRRFSNELLYDPIARVAREPLRKLELDGRLIGAAQICLSMGFTPENILIGIVGALLFVNQDDPDNHLAFIRKSLSSKALLTYIVGLRQGEALEMVMEERYLKIAGTLEKLIKEDSI